MNTSFAFVIPTRNSSKTLRQALLSLAGQSYPMWRAVIINDCSDDDTLHELERTACDLHIQDRITVLGNETRKWEVANVVAGLSLVESDEVVCRFDLDDYLTDLNALEIIAGAYDKHEDLDALWTAHRWFDDRGVTNQNISAAMPSDADPYVFPWVSSHLKTWRKSVSDNVPDANYRSENGEYIKRAGDQAIYLPVLKLARKRMYCPISTYAYRCDMSPETFQTDDARFQKDEADFLRNRGFVK